MTMTTTNKNPLSTPQSTIASLPDDLLLRIIARVSRLYYPTLSLVSRSFRSLLASPELYKTRSLLGHTESCLYVCVQLFGDKLTWCTLCKKPDQTLTNETSKEKSSGYILARSQFPIPKWIAYDSEKGRWDLVEGRVHDIKYRDSNYCEIDNVLYFFNNGALRWYDNEVRSWKDLKGLVGLPKFPPCAFVRLAGYGGNLAVLWYEYFVRNVSYKKLIWCAEIALERRKSGEIWGKVE